MKSKQFISGLIVGAILASGVGVYAASEIISAYKVDDTFIYVDNEKIELANDTGIIKYNGRLYTPARAVASALDAEVIYKEENGVNNVYITKPEPVIVEVIKEVPVETENSKYRELPAKDSGLGVSVIIKEAYTPIDELLVKLELTNVNFEGMVMFEYGKFRMEAEDGTKYYAKRILNSQTTMFFSSLQNDIEDVAETLKFPVIPAGTKVTLYMPFTRTNVGGKVESDVIEIPFVIEDYNIE